MPIGALIGLATQIVPQIIGAAKQGKEAKAAEGGGEAKGGGEAAPAKPRKPAAQRVQEKLAQAKSPAEVDQIKQQILAKIDKGGKDTKGELKQLVTQLAEQKKAELGGGGAPAGAMPGGMQAMQAPQQVGGAAQGQPQALPAGGAPMPPAAAAMPGGGAMPMPQPAPGAAMPGQPGAQDPAALLAKLDPGTLAALAKALIEKLMGGQQPGAQPGLAQAGAQPGLAQPGLPQQAPIV
jgi:hypothetical protein